MKKTVSITWTKNCTHDHSYVKNTSVTKIPVIDHSKAKARVIIAMQMWLNLGINIKISILGTIPMHALWRKVVLFIIKNNFRVGFDNYRFQFRQNSLNIHFKQIICMFSSKKKNVELNLMFISQANNIGNRSRYRETGISLFDTFRTPYLS
jgi:hypothetical protein